MGRLTDDMTRLSDEIATLDRTRETCLEGIKDTVATLRAGASEMQADFRKEHAAMADRAKSDLSGFVSGLKETVGDLQTRFGHERTAMAKKTKADTTAAVLGVREAVNGLKGAVADMRQEFAADIAGGHRALSGAKPTTMEPKEPKEKHKEPSATKAKKRKG